MESVQTLGAGKWRPYLGQNKIKTINVEHWKALQFIEFDVGNKVQCPKCHYKFDSFYCMDKLINMADIETRVTTTWKCANGGCLYEVEYLRTIGEETQ